LLIPHIGRFHRAAAFVYAFGNAARAVAVDVLRAQAGFRKAQFGDRGEWLNTTAGVKNASVGTVGDDDPGLLHGGLRGGVAWDDRQPATVCRLPHRSDWRMGKSFSISCPARAAPISR